MIRNALFFAALGLGIQVLTFVFKLSQGALNVPYDSWFLIGMGLIVAAVWCASRSMRRHVESDTPHRERQLTITPSHNRD